ncbi:hypothetical protein ZTR_01439 [Talaromyces verruculosus]|nr:hypothetical protein ZTR_01439 [Talaromyces verruculosus]
MSDPQNYERADYNVIRNTILNPGSDQEKVHVFRCSEVEFARFERAFGRGEREGITYRSLTYDGERELLTFVTMTTAMHEAPTSWLNLWIGSLGLGSRANSRAELLDGLKSDGSNTSKQPDGGLFIPPSRDYPTITIDTGYSESYEKLVRDAEILLDGSNGEIGIVILVKLTPLKPGEHRISHGFVEVWWYDYKKCPPGPARLTGKRTLYPPPKSARDQGIQLTWESIVREEIKNIPSGLMIDPPPPLKLDSLREAIDAATGSKLKRATREPDPAAVYEFQNPIEVSKSNKRKRKRAC